MCSLLCVIFIFSFSSVERQKNFCLQAMTLKCKAKFGNSDCSSIGPFKSVMNVSAVIFLLHFTYNQH